MKDEASGVLLMRTWHDWEAEIVRGLLASCGIPCQVVSDIPHSVSPLTVDGLGEIRIFVPPSAYDEAMELLAEHRRSGIEGAREPGDGGPSTDDPEGAPE